MKKLAPNKLTNILIYISIVIFLCGSGYKYGQWQLQKGSRSQSSFTVLNADNPSLKENSGETIDFGLFWDVWDKLDQKYVDETKLDKKKMYYGAIKGMVASLGDPYTFFLTPEENKQSKDDLGGKFEGIGAQLGLKESHIVVIAPLKKSPAMEAGMKAGDIIVEVDGKSTKDWTLAQTVSKIRGTGGTKVTIKVDRAGKAQIFNLVRRQIQVDSVELSYENENGKKIAYLKLSQFGDTTNDEWDTAIEDIKSQWDNKQINGMVLDLRDNPGGYLESAVYIASEFLERGQLVVKQATSGYNDRTYNVDRTGRLLDIPLVVIINGGSASASEILSGALRDHKRAVLTGEKSFGKGSVQEPMDLKGRAGLHVTIAKWLLPSGEWINGKGIQPSIKVTNEADENNTLTKDSDKQLRTALQTVIK
ncbi:hypothetical protein BH09PAT2_BH09PAT2_00490 [soil metagenome]